MSREIIDSIRKVEANAKKDKSDAAAEAKERVAKAADAAKNEYEASRLRAESDMADKLAMIAEQSDALLSKSRAEAEAEAAKETEAAMAHMDDAVSLIIGELAKNVGK